MQLYLYYNYEKYPLSPLKPRLLVLIEQYLLNISDPVYSVHQSFMWFLWLDWRKSTFYPVTALNDSKCWPIVTSSIQEPATSNCDVTMTDCSRVLAMNAFLSQWCWGQWFKEFVKDTVGVCAKFFIIIEKVCEAAKCLASDVMINWQRAMRMARNNVFDQIVATGCHVIALICLFIYVLILWPPVFQHGASLVYIYID